jgi:dipeptidyl aminopeptidase/acylaminoacyl peptidase
MFRFYFTCLFLCVGFAVVGKAQNKKPLTHDVYDSWNTIQERAVSNDGKWITYTLKPLEGDSKVLLHDISGKKDKIRTFERAYSPKISEDSRYLVFLIKPRLDSTKAMRRRKVPADKLPKDSLGIYSFAKDSLIKIPNVKSFRMPERGAGWLAYQLEIEQPNKKKAGKPDKKDSLSLDSLKKKPAPKKNEKPEKVEKTDSLKKKDYIKVTSTEPKETKNDKKADKGEKPEKIVPKTKEQLEIERLQTALEEAKKLAEARELLLKTKEEQEQEKKKVEPKKKEKPPKKETKDSGTKLILRNLATAKQDTFLFVTEYTFSKYLGSLGFASTGNDTTFRAGVYVYDLQEGKLQHIHQLAGKTKNLAFDEQGKQLAFVTDSDTTKKHEKELIKHFELYYWAEKQKNATVLVDRKTAGLPTDYMLNEEFKLYFSKDGGKLYFGTNPLPMVADTTLLPEEIVSVDVWHWQDSKIQPQQNVELKNEQRRAYLAVAYPKQRKIVQLASPEVPIVMLAQEGNAEVALGISSKPYEIAITWEGETDYDAYLISLKENKPKKIKEKIRSRPRFSPNGEYMFWYNKADSAWYSYSLKSGQTFNLTKNVKTKFYNELFDMPDVPEAYGVAGWTQDDELFLVYDRYDIWALHPENKTPAQRITQKGKENKLEFRYVRLNFDVQYIEPDLFLQVTDEEKKDEGYFTLKLGSPEAPRKLTLEPMHFGLPTKAREADRYIFTKQTFKQFPDIYHSDLSFTKVSKVSNANPQQAQYLWGTVEMTKWHAPNGEELSGLLYKPENFDAEKKYPMIVYFYERLSDELHYHEPPRPSASVVIPTMFTSNGYVVFMPDITYRKGQPGQSAYDAIMSGVAHVLNMGYVDREKIGLNGQSWGGYQTAYLITRTDLFACAMAGAPVSNMTSAYGGIRWGTGLSRTFQYERSQSRIGATLWEKPFAYLENSPLFQADKIKTPLLIMHNDKDGAVPWYQGIELYNALRRFQRPVWMLTYNGEDHNLVETKNKKDLSVRMQQFYDYYLKYAPMPYWMKYGVPATEKTIKRRFELVEEK